MGKLSHIEDVEQRSEEQTLAEETPRADQPAEDAQTQQPAAAPEGELPAEADEEFHGLDSTQLMGPLHKVLIALATVVVVVAIVYVVNCWVHFI